MISLVLVQKKLSLWDLKMEFKGYKLWDPEDKKFVYTRDVTFDETSVLKDFKFSAGG